MAFKDLMGRSEGPEPGRPEPAAPPAATARSAPRSAAPSTFLDASSVVSGKLHCSESLRIDGKVKGEVRCGHTVVIGETAEIQATVEADTVTIAGEVQGDITAHRKITLEKSARVTGDLCTPGIVIQEGAKLEGRIMIGEEAQPSEQKAASRPAASQKPAAKAPTPTPGAPPPAGS